MNEKCLNNNKSVQKNNGINEKIRKCPECGSKNIITDYQRAETSCADCGLVITENIVDLGPEWRMCNPEQSGRIRAEPTGDRLGTPYARIPRLKMHGKIQIGNTTPSNEITLSRAFQEANRICVVLGLSEIIEDEVKDTCKMAKKENLFHAMGIDRVVAAIVMIVCQRNKRPMTAKEISSVSPAKDFGKIISGSKTIKRRLKIRATANRDPCDFLPSFCSKLELNMQVENFAKKIIERVKEQNLLNGKKPSGIAAAAIYIAAFAFDKEIRAETLSKIAYTSWKTIRTRMNEIIGNESILSYLDKI